MAFASCGLAWRLGLVANAASAASLRDQQDLALNGH
jgi:hypothetical protein